MWRGVALNISLEFSYIHLKNEVTDPLPLVPAIWIVGGSLKCGLLSLASNLLSLVKDKSIF